MKSKEQKIKLILDYMAGKANKADLKRGEFYEYTAIDINGVLVSENYFKDREPISKDEFKEVEASPGDAIIWREVKTYG